MNAPITASGLFLCSPLYVYLTFMHWPKEWPMELYWFPGWWQWEKCHQVRGAHAFVFATPRITCFPSTDLIATGHSYCSVLTDCVYLYCLCMSLLYCVWVCCCTLYTPCGSTSYEIRTLNFENGIANEAIALEWVVSRALWDFKVVKKQCAGVLLSVKCCCFMWKLSCESHAIWTSPSENEERKTFDFRLSTFTPLRVLLVMKTLNGMLSWRLKSLQSSKILSLYYHILHVCTIPTHQVYQHYAW